MFALLSKQTGAKRVCSFPHFTVLSPPPLTQLPPHLGKNYVVKEEGSIFNNITTLFVWLLSEGLRQKSALTKIDETVW